MGSSPSSVLSSSKLLGSEIPRVWTPPLRELTPKSSRGFECIAFAEEVLGIVLLPWQRWMLIHALETLPDGTFRFRTVLLLVARQSGKSTLMQIVSLWRMYVDGAPLVIGTAQNLDIAEEVWQGAVDMAQETPELAAEIEQVFMQPGKKFLRLMSGSRYKVAAASRRGGRGLSGDLVLLDELREHQTWEAWAAVANTTMARVQAQVWAASNAGDNTSIVLAHLRRQAHFELGDPDGINEGETALPGETPDSSLAIFEWSATPGCDMWDRAGWAQANPALGYTTSERAIIAAAAAPETRFRTENLCQWVDTMREGAFPPGVWETNRVDAKTPAGKPVVSVDVRTGLQQSVAICVAAPTKLGFDLLDVALYKLGADTQWAEDFVVAQTASILAAHKLEEVVVDEYAENGHLIPLFDAAGIKVRKLKLHDMRDAARGLTDALINGNVKHTGAEPLTVAVLGAGKRTSGEGFVWSQAKSSTDVSPLRAATAAWWVLRSDRDVEYPIEASYF